MHDRLVALVTGANTGIGLPRRTFSSEDGPLPW
jgi:hypothetical protein